MPRERLSNIRTSFQFKIFCIFTILTAFISCLFITLYSFDSISETRLHAAKEVHLLARQLAASVRLPLYAENRDLLRQFAEQAGSMPAISRVVIAAVDGRVLADVRSPVNNHQAEVIGETVQVRSLSLADSLRKEQVAGKSAMAPLIGTVRIERGTDDLTRTIRQDVVLSCLLAALFWLAVSALSYLALRRTTRSYNALVRGVKTMQDGDYASRIDIVCSDEPGRAALAINELARMLQLRDQENLRLNAELVKAVETEVQAKEDLAAAKLCLELEVSERIHAEQTARKGEQTLRNLMDIMPVGVVWTDQDGTVEYLNNFFVERFGYGGEEIPTLQAWFALAFPDPAYCGRVADAQREALARSRSAERADFRPHEARVTCKDGSIRHVLIFNQVSENRTIIVLTDITDRELLQEQFAKVQKLESLGVLAGGIAHNFNNALTGVVGFISLASNTLDEAHRAAPFLKHAEKALLRAAGMAKQLLTFARGGAPVKKVVSLQNLLQEAASLALNASNVQCVLEMPPVSPLVRADEGQLMQVFNNILINAMQAMPEGGIITIGAENSTPVCAEPGQKDDAGYVSVAITDQGHGIAEADLPKIFDPYFTTKDTNTGLGLASAHSIIYKHGGRISVTSLVGQGTTFTISLPLCKEVQSPNGDAGKPLRMTGQGSGRVLIMDDDEMVRELSGEILGFLGYQAISCVDGKDAVVLYESSRRAGNPFMAVILDLTIPGGMGGVEAARQILAIDPEAKLIVSSGYSFDPVMAGYQQYGFCGAVAKPYKASELGHELSRLH